MSEFALKSALRFRRSHESVVVPALAHARIDCNSASLNWKGLYLEVGSNVGCNVDDLTVDGHFVGLQLNPGPVHIKTRSCGSWMDIVMPHHSMWLHPEGTPFSVRHSIHSRWAGAIIDGRHFDAVMGCHYELDSSYVLHDEILSHHLLGLIAYMIESQQHGDDPVISESMIRNFLLLLGKRHGRPSAALSVDAEAVDHRIGLLLKWVESNLGADISVESMAARVGLSPAYFSREFKRAIGVTPWTYVMDRRVALAHARLAQGQSACSVAMECGFADQAHMSRTMKSRLGVLPSEVRVRRKSGVTLACASAIARALP